MMDFFPPFSDLMLLQKIITVCFLHNLISPFKDTEKPAMGQVGKKNQFDIRILSTEGDTHHDTNLRWKGRPACLCSSQPKFGPATTLPWGKGNLFPLTPGNAAASPMDILDLLHRFQWHRFKHSWTAPSWEEIELGSSKSTRSQHHFSLPTHLPAVPNAACPPALERAPKACLQYHWTSTRDMPIASYGLCLQLLQLPGKKNLRRFQGFAVALGVLELLYGLMLSIYILVHFHMLCLYILNERLQKSIFCILALQGKHTM